MPGSFNVGMESETGCNDMELEVEGQEMWADTTDNPLPDLADGATMVVLETPGPGIFVRRKRRARTLAQEHPLRQWMGLRQKFLEADMRREGRGRHWGICTVCRAALPSFRCRDCSGIQNFCHSCVVVTHRFLPYHIPEVSCAWRCHISLAHRPLL